MFLTTGQFLPQHHAQRQQVLQIMTGAEAKGHTRLVEMNQQVLTNLDRIITTLEEDPSADREQVTDASCNSQHVIAAARQRSQATRRRAIAALRRMDDAGAPINFDTLARAASVSRSWLYNQPDLRAEVERLRQRRTVASRRTPPERQRASDASLLARLNIASARIQQLEADNKRLRNALAEALGERRADPNRDTPRQHLSTATTPS